MPTSYGSAAPCKGSGFHHLSRFKAIGGGVPGVFCMFGSYESAAPYGTTVEPLIKTDTFGEWPNVRLREVSVL